MPENGFWRFNACPEQKSRPINSVKPQNILAHQMRVDRPVLRKLRVISLEPDPGEIRRQCIEPHVEDVVWIVRKRNPPLQGHAAYGQILQTAFHERDNLVPAALGTDEPRILFVKLEKTILERRQLEKVTFFGKPFGLPAAIRTWDRRGRINFRSVRFTG